MEINRFTLLAIISWIGGLGILMFQAIAQAMDKDVQWTALLLGRLTGDSLDEFAEKIPVEVIQTGYHFLMYELPLYQLLLGVGAILMVLGMIFHD